VDRGRVFALDGDGHLTALDVRSGATRWRIHLMSSDYYWSPPVAADGTVYVNGVGTGGVTSAIDERTALTRWSHSTIAGSDGCVAVAAGVVYEAEACQVVSAWSARTGALQWFHSTNCTGAGGEAPAVYHGLMWHREVGSGRDVILD